MSSDNQSGGAGSSFWTSMNGVVTAIAGLLTAAAGLLVALFQVGVLGDDDSDPQQPAAVVSSSSSAASPTGAGEPVDGPGAVLAGTWQGQATGSDEGTFAVRLTIEPTCAMRKPCGTIYVSSAPCTGRVRLWGVDGMTYEFYVDRFTAGSSSDCTEGAGEYFVLTGETLRYTTGYSDSTGVLERT